jgi:hypothetical protein
MDTYVPENLWGKMLPSIDNTQLMNDCLEVERLLLDSVLTNTPIGVYGSKTTASFRQYNLLSFPIESFQNLYHTMVSVIKPCMPKETHVLQCWLNIFRGNEFIDWHHHWRKRYRAVHGFYCVNVTPSYTEYKFEHSPGSTYKVESKEGLLVFGKSDGDIHRSSPWQDLNTPRVTIAFDIIPVSTLLAVDRERPNHFLPF